MRRPDHSAQACADAVSLAFVVDVALKNLVKHQARGPWIRIALYWRLSAAKRPPRNVSRAVVDVLDLVSESVQALALKPLAYHRGLTA